MAKPRYSLSEIAGVKESYRASPGSDVGVGQLVFALNSSSTQTDMGCCVPGSVLYPWGICCFFAPNMNSSCTGGGICVTNGFTVGTSTTVFVALGAMNGCGATLWRRIS